MRAKTTKNKQKTTEEIMTCGDTKTKKDFHYRKSFSKEVSSRFELLYTVLQTVT